MSPASSEWQPAQVSPFSGRARRLLGALGDPLHRRHTGVEQGDVGRGHRAPVGRRGGHGALCAESDHRPTALAIRVFFIVGSSSSMVGWPARTWVSLRLLRSCLRAGDARCPCGRRCRSGCLRAPSRAARAASACRAHALEAVAVAAFTNRMPASAPIHVGPASAAFELLLGVDGADDLAPQLLEASTLRTILCVQSRGTWQSGQVARTPVRLL